MKSAEGLKKELVKHQKKNRCNDKNCISDEVCEKSHAFKEQEKRTLCNKFKRRSNCKYGEDCKFLHCEKTREAELKKMAAVLNDYEKNRGTEAYTRLPKTKSRRMNPPRRSHPALSRATTCKATAPGKTSTMVQRTIVSQSSLSRRKPPSFPG